MLYWNGESGKFDVIHFHHSVQVHFDLLLDENKYNPINPYSPIVTDLCIIDMDYLIFGDKNDLCKISSDVSWKLITGWLTEYTKNHQNCNLATKQDTWFPTRLIDVRCQKVGSAPRFIVFET
jgi:hypothetical protein